jgi:hypothetical protein
MINKSLLSWFVHPMLCFPQSLSKVSFQL